MTEIRYGLFNCTIPFMFKTYFFFFILVCKISLALFSSWTIFKEIFAETVNLNVLSLAPVQFPVRNLRLRLQSWTKVTKLDKLNLLH